MKRVALEKKLKIKLDEKCELSIHIASTASMIQGVFHETRTKCGRKNCRCYEGEGHLCRRLTWSDNGKSKIKSIPVEHEEWAHETTRNYKSFRKGRQRLTELDKEIQELLDLLESEIIKETWKENKNIPAPEGIF